MASLANLPEVSTIQVYREDPAWGALEAAGKRWFQMARQELDRLWVTTYEVHGDCVTVEDIRRHAKEVRTLHPDCVLIHL